MALDQIDTIIVVIMENRSFDHALGYLSLDGPGQMPVEGVRSSQTWVDANENLYHGAAYPSVRLDPAVQAIVDPSHDYNTIDKQIAIRAQGGGLMGGFVTSYAELTSPAPTDLTTVMGYYDAATVATYDFFARHFRVCDHWFAALPAGTQPNRLMAMAGYSNVYANGSFRLPHEYTVYEWLNDHKVDCCAYQWGEFFPFFSLDWDRLPAILWSLTFEPATGPFRRYSHFAETWRSDQTMPSVIFIEPEYGNGPHKDPCDDHPNTGIAKGQYFLAQVYSDVISNPARWAKTMMIVTYDEHGGFFDHVDPLQIPAVAGGWKFPTSGVRVPAFVISPLVEPGAVFNEPLDHTAILQLLADKYTPGHGYSIKTNPRQAFINRLTDILMPAGNPGYAPAIPPETMAAIKAAADAAPVPDPLGSSIADPEDARAFHNLAIKASIDHAEWIAQPGWESLRAYLANHPSR